MHVLIIPSTYPKYKGDLSGIFFQDQAVALRKNGCEVGVICPEITSIRNLRNISKIKWGFEKITDDGLRVVKFHALNYFPLIHSLYFQWTRYLYKKLFKKYTILYGIPDIIHAHEIFNGGLLAVEIGEKFGIPVLITEHSSAFALRNFSPTKLRLARNACNKSKINIAVSNSLAEFLNAKIKASSKWIYLPNMLDDIFTEYKYEEYQQEKFTFICVGSLDSNKNHIAAIEAFAREFGKDENKKLIIIGAGEELGKLISRTETLNVRSKIDFLGELSRIDVLKYITQSNVMVLPSKYETFGVVLIESLALGRPVIATRCGGPESIVRQQDGLLIEPNDINALSLAMKSMVKNYENYNSLEIRQACIERFGSRSIAKKIINNYSEIISENIKYKNKIK
jgi:glycosyltransferase involved in cell wall biosynthesis